MKISPWRFLCTAAVSNKNDVYQVFDTKLAIRNDVHEVFDTNPLQEVREISFQSI